MTPKKRTYQEKLAYHRSYNKEYQRQRQKRNQYHPELMKTPYKPLDTEPVK